MDNVTFFRNLVCAALPVAARELGEAAHAADVAARAVSLATWAFRAELAVDVTRLDAYVPARRSEAFAEDFEIGEGPY